MLKDLATIFGSGPAGHSSSQEDARDAVSFVVGVHLADHLLRQIAIDAARLELASDAEPASTLDASGGAHVRGGNAPVIERAVGDQRANCVVGVVFFVALRDKPVLELRGRVVASADEVEGGGKRLRRCLYVVRKTTSEVISSRRRLRPPRDGRKESRQASASCGDPA
jgi:hypothetical protein